MSYACCYVLTDNEKLQYYNQLMVSLSSLRYTGFKGNVYIITDHDTAALLAPRRSELDEYSAEIVIAEIEECYTTKEKSRYLKTTMRKYIPGDLFYIDTDTLFVSCLPERISDADFAMAYDRNGLDDYSYRWHKILFDKCGMDLPANDDHRFFNAGVIWMRDAESVHHIFDQWHSLWKKERQIYGVVEDQLSLNYLWKNKYISISELDDRFNVQIKQDYFSPSALCKAYILHLYNSEYNPSIFLLHHPALKNLDYRDTRIQQIIHDPFAAFSDCRWMKKDGVMDNYLKTDAFSRGFGLYKMNSSVLDDYLKTDAFSFGFYVFKKHKRLFSIFEYLFHILKKCKDLLTGNSSK